MINLKTAVVLGFFSWSTHFATAQELQETATDNKLEMAKNFQIVKEKLQLTPDQESKFKEISLKYGEKLKTLKNSDSDKKAKRTEMKQLKSNKDLEIKAILSEQQFKTYQELQANRRNKMKERIKDKKAE